MFNILEALGKVSRTRYDEAVVYAGLRAVKEHFKQAAPSTEGTSKRCGSGAKGFKGLIDLLLYATALGGGPAFLTRDRELAEFLEEAGELVDRVLLREEDFGEPPVDVLCVFLRLHAPVGGGGTRSKT